MAVKMYFRHLYIVLMATEAVVPSLTSTTYCCVIALCCNTDKVWKQKPSPYRTVLLFYLCDDSRYFFISVNTVSMIKRTISSLVLQ
ncbi:hypothetical protein BDQ17DRAFT_1371284 [Cyathus striatus]|nr:hypothetical protein BDQ17DRAFT_1371284 [Cyathus striatus]